VSSLILPSRAVNQPQGLVDIKNEYLDKKLTNLFYAGPNTQNVFYALGNIGSYTRGGTFAPLGGVTYWANGLVEKVNNEWFFGNNGKCVVEALGSGVAGPKTVLFRINKKLDVSSYEIVYVANEKIWFNGYDADGSKNKLSFAEATAWTEKLGIAYNGKYTKYSVVPEEQLATSQWTYALHGTRSAGNARLYQAFDMIQPQVVSFSLYASFDLALPADELISLTANPWQIFKPRKRILYFDVSSSFPVLSSLTASYITSSGGRLTAST